MKKQKLLLLTDVAALGRSGDIVLVRAGFWRNFLQPKGLAVQASAQTEQLQTSLRAERQKRAAEDLQKANELSQQLAGITITTKVKVDPEGKLYGSVNANDIVDLLQEKGIAVQKHNISIARPIKALGSHKINLKLDEGVLASCELLIESEEMT